MTTIKVKSRITDNFGDAIGEAFNIMLSLEKAPKNQPVTIDLSDCVFSNPFLLVAVSILCNQYRKNGYNIELNTNYRNAGFRDYMNFVHFPDGLKPDEIPGGNYEEVINHYLGRTYIPIINFPALRSPVTTPIRDQFLGVISNLLSTQLGLTGNIKIAVSYLIVEAINNIVDHSRAERGYIFAQYYPNKLFMDLCIADNGISILGSYKATNVTGINTDAEAIQSAVNGKSTKPEPGGRGFGIRTSKKMLVNGLKGKYFLLSGNAFLLSTVTSEDIVHLPSLIWSGTILALRIPIINQAEFNPSDYYDS